MWLLRVPFRWKGNCGKHHSAPNPSGLQPTSVAWARIQHTHAKAYSLLPPDPSRTKFKLTLTPLVYNEQDVYNGHVLACFAQTKRGWVIVHVFRTAYGTPRFVLSFTGFTGWNRRHVLFPQHSLGHRTPPADKLSPGWRTWSAPLAAWLEICLWKDAQVVQTFRAGEFVPKAGWVGSKKRPQG